MLVHWDVGPTRRWSSVGDTQDPKGLDSLGDGNPVSDTSVSTNPIGCRGQIIEYEFLSGNEQRNQPKSH